MSGASRASFTRQRKRAASRADLNPQDLPATPIGSWEAQSTPSSRYVPELDWGDSPESPNHFLSTPSDETSPRTSSTDKSAFGNLLRPLKEPRTSSQIKALEASKLSNLTCNGLKSAPIFASFLYPVLPPIPPDLYYLVKDDFSSRNFNFFKASRASNNNIPFESEPRKTAAPVFRSGLQNGTEPERKRVKNTAMMSEETIESEMTAEIISTSTPIKPETITCRPTRQKKEAGVNLQSETQKSCSRILPSDMMERWRGDSRRCVASLDKRPDARCSRSLKVPENMKNWAPIQLSKLEDASDLVACETYLRDLVKIRTCAQHRKIAEARLTTLLGQYLDCRNRHARTTKSSSRHETADIRSWLKALTMTLTEEGHYIVQPLQQTDLLSQTSVNETVVDLQPDPAVSHKQHLQLLGAGQTYAKQTPKSGHTFQSVHQSSKLIDTSQNLTVSRIVKMTQSFERLQDNQTADASSEISAIQTTDITRNSETVHFLDVDSNKIAKTQTTTDTIRTVEAAETFSAEPDCVEKCKTITTAKRVETFSTFNPPPIDGISFVAAQSNIVTLRRSTRIAARTSKLDEKELQTIHQKFSWYLPGNSGTSTVEQWIHRYLIKNLTLQEYDLPLKGGNRPSYPNQADNYPGQGLIYMYWVPGNFGFVKIGKTSGESTETRLKDWKSQCGHKTEEHTRGEKGVALQLPHAYRIEKLVHAELKDFRIKENRCEKCKKGHNEWFAVPPGHALKVIKKWSDWMKTSPYAERKGVWGLENPISIDDILCKPIELPVGYIAALPTLQRHTQPKMPAKKVRGKKKST